MSTSWPAGATNRPARFKSAAKPGARTADRRLKPSLGRDLRCTLLRQILRLLLGQRVAQLLGQLLGRLPVRSCVRESKTRQSASDSVEETLG